jgi:phosphoglycerol transferase MdoB-like AlkP superfamily enzyme
MIGIFFIGRLALFALYFDRFKDSGSDYWMSFIYGLRMDTIAASILLVIPLVLLTLMPKSFKNFVRVFLKYYFLIILAILIYVENATFPFFAQYDVRPNYLFVEYLEYPKEVFSMILADYKSELLVAISMILIFIYLYLKSYKDELDLIFKESYLKRFFIFLSVGVLLFIGIRSSFGHRPANNSDAMFSSNRVVNEITKNSIYSIGTAIYTNNKFGATKLIKQYGKMDKDEALSRTSKLLGIDLLDKNAPFKREVKSHFKTKKPKNLIIFLQESLGAQFVKATGGEDGITPNLNRLSKEGVLFKNLYSNGTRSIRGIAGVVAGNFSVPGKGVLKRNKSQNDFFTISSLLEPLGYHTMFLYGGESRFDNMRGWFLGNGFDEIIDESKFENPQFVGTWGVCDEEVVKRANREFKKLYDRGEKFAGVIFSTSNHAPFDFPDGKIDLIEGEKKKSVKNAIKYADFAIGEFIKLAKKSGYYKDSVIVVIADHNVRVYGDDMVPIDMFHIPAIILGSDIKPKVYEKLSTQPDVLATALDLMGLDLTYPIMGHSIYEDKKKDLSLMQFNSTYALRVGDKVAILRPNKKAQTFIYKDKHLIKTDSDEELEKGVLAFVITLDYLYNKKLYR